MILALKISEKRLFFATISAFIILSSFCAFRFPLVQATEMTIQQKGLSVINNVLNVEISNYSVNAKSLKDSYVGAVQQDDISYDLEFCDSRLKILCTYVEGKLLQLWVVEKEGKLALTKTLGVTNAREMAQDFLSSYQEYTEDSLYGELKSALNSVEDNKNQTRVFENAQFEVTSTEDSATFTWTYLHNGVLAPSKVIALSFKEGFLNYFVDSWYIHSVGSTNINLSEAEAVAIALETAKTHNWSAKLDAETLEFSKFNETNVKWTALLFDYSSGAEKVRDDNILTVYPVWRVGIALDKWCGNMYGIEVDIWADTKAVRSVQEAWSNLLPSEVDAINQEAELGFESSFIFPVLAASVVVCFVIMWIIQKKHLCQVFKWNEFKKGGILLCMLVGTTLILGSFASASATTRGAVIWASESTGQNADICGYFRKSALEIEAQRSISNTISSYFANYGYDGRVKGENEMIYHQGATAVEILDDISYYRNHFDYMAVVAFDHGIGDWVGYPIVYAPPSPGEWHYRFEDSVGTEIGYPIEDWPYHDSYYHPENAVYDMDIFNIQVGGKLPFAFISTCMSADLDGQGWIDGDWPPWPGRARGMTYAWTGRLPGIDMSLDGYGDPDDVNQVYIGFPWGSPSLTQPLPYTSGSETYEFWVQKFFYYALNYDVSVNYALDYASSLLEPGKNFGSGCLRNGFSAYWEGCGPPIAGCTMAVYGNGRIHLRYYDEHDLTVNAYDPSMNPVNADVYIDDEYRGTSGNSFEVYNGMHDIRVESSSNVFHYYTGYAELQNEIDVSISQDTTITANYYSNPAPQYELSISAGEGGTTDPEPDDYLFTPQFVTVTAYPDNDHFFDCWILDSVPYYVAYGETPNITIAMSSNHTLQACFTEIPEYRWVSDIDSYLEYLASDPENLIGFRNDSDYMVLQGWGPEGEEYMGWIIGEMDAEAAGHIYAYGYTDGALYADQVSVYVADEFPEDPEEWEHISTQYINNTSPDWIDLGSSEDPFNYILLATEDMETYTYLMLDSIRVDPIINYTLTISSVGNGTTDPPPATYLYSISTIVEVEAVPDSGCLLDYWLLDSIPAGASEVIYVTMDENHSVEANFRPVEYYDLTVSSGGNGTTTPSPDTYQYAENTLVNVTAVADTGYEFYCWILDGNENEPYSYGNQTALLIDYDHSLEARFVEQQLCEVTVYAIEVISGEPVETSVYCDEEWVGDTVAYFEDEEWVGEPVVFYATLGGHEITVDSGGLWEGEYYVGFYSFLIDEEEVFTGEVTFTESTFTVIANYVSNK